MAVFYENERDGAHSSYGPYGSRAKWAGTDDDWFDETETVRRQVLALGIKCGEVFDQHDVACILPDHHGCRATLRTDYSGHWQYVCEHEQRTTSLAAVRAAIAYGEPKPFMKPVEFARWRDRLNFEAGLRPDVEDDPVSVWVPDNAKPAVLHVARGLSLFLGLREPQWDRHSEFVFAKTFGAAYCGMPEMQFRHARDALKRAGSIHAVGKRRVGIHDAIEWQLGVLEQSEAA